MRTFKHLLIAFLFIIIPIALWAQVFTQVNEIAAPISATGSSNLANIGSAWAQLNNPAGLCRLTAVSYTHLTLPTIYPV